MPQMQNRVQETTTTGGTGTLTLAGAVTGYLTFASGFSTGTSLFYTIDNGIGEWEIGIGTLVTTGTLSRVTVIASSNGGALVNFGSGTKRVFCSAPTHSLVPDQDSKSGYVLTTDGTNPSWTQTLNGITIGNLTAAGGAFTTLSASSTVSGTGFSTYLASPPAIGGTTPAAGKFTTLEATGNTTLGDAAGDTLTIIGTAVSCPNNLNFDSNTLFIDAANNRVGIGKSSPGAILDVASAIKIGNGTSGILSNVLMYFDNPVSAGSHTAICWNLVTTNTDSAKIAAHRISGSYATDLTFSTAASASQTSTERLRIDSSGNLLLRQSSNAANTSVSFDTTVQNALTLDSSGNLGIGTTTFGTSAATVLGIKTGTAPSTGPADTVQFYSSDRSAGNTIPSFFCEGSGVITANTTAAATHRIAMRINGTVYYLLANTTA